MKDINNNIDKTGFPPKIIGISKNVVKKGNGDEAAHFEPEAIEKAQEAQATINRSLVKRNVNGGNISKSVDEAITQMKEIEDHPRLVAFCENIYDACYQDLISRGADPIEAAVKASEIAIRAQREFRD